MKKFTIFAGVNGAGKSTLYSISKVGNSNLGIRINTDEIVREIGDWKNPGDQIKAARKAIEIRNNCLKLDISFNQETTLTGKSILNTIKLAKEKGFKIYLNYVGIESSQLAKERIKNRVSKGGHNIPDEVVEKRYDESLKNLKSIIRIIDEIVIYDNTKEFQPIMTIKNGKILDKEKLIPEWIKFIEKDLSNEKNKEESLEKNYLKY